MRPESDDVSKNALETARNYGNIIYGYYCPPGSVLITWQLTHYFIRVAWDVGQICRPKISVYAV